MVVPPAAVVSVAEVTSVTGTASPTGFEQILNENYVIMSHKLKKNTLTKGSEVPPISIAGKPSALMIFTFTEE